MDPVSDMLLLLGGGAVGGGLVNGLGAWYLRTRLQKVDRISRQFDRFIAYMRLTDKRFAEFWLENGGGE